MLFAGVAREKITPPLGTCLFGYKPGVEATSVNDDINVNVLYLTDSHESVVFIDCDMGLLANEVADRMRSEAAALTGLSKSRIVASATHTHSAPNASDMEGWGGIDYKFVDEILMPKTLKAVAAAAGSLCRVRLGVGQTESRLGINRREIDPESNVHLGQNPWGPFDSRLTVLSLVRDDGSQLVNIVHYGCHGTCAGCNHEVTRDWPGPMTDALEREYGGLAMFFNAASGDVGPRLSNGKTTADITYVAEVGAVAAADALRARQGISDYRDDAVIDVITGTVTLPYRPLPSREYLENELADILARYPDPSKLTNLKYLEYRHVLDMLDIYKQGKKPETEYSYEQVIVAVGGIAIVPFPFELFSVIAMRLRHYSPFDDTLCICNTNGSNVYLPNKEEICRGGYEIGTFRFGKAFGLTDDSDSLLIKQNLSLLIELFKRRK